MYVCVCVHVEFLLFLKSISNIFIKYISKKYLSNKCNKNLCIKKRGEGLKVRSTEQYLYYLISILFD